MGNPEHPDSRLHGALARIYPRHGGIILAAHRRWTLSELINALDHVLARVQAEEFIGQVHWLNAWRTR